MNHPNSLCASFLVLIALVLLPGSLFASANTSDPKFAPLPPALLHLDQELVVQHFADPVFATTEEEEEPGIYFWKHNTAVLSPFADAEVVRFGAYLYYNEQWNLRVEMEPKDFAKLFDCPKAQIKKGQPYTFTENWRRDSGLHGGWAMWYFVALKENGDSVGGVGKLYTAGATYEEAHYVLDPARSSLKWTGFSAWTDYAPDGTLDFKSGDLLLADGQLFQTQVAVDLGTLRSETGGIAGHLMSPDFFDAKQHPLAEFELLEAVSATEGEVMVQGRFSFHGSSVVARIPLTISIQDDEVVARGTFKLDRSDYGIDKSMPTKDTKKTRGSEIADAFQVVVEAVFVKE